MTPLLSNDYRFHIKTSKMKMSNSVYPEDSNVLLKKQQQQPISNSDCCSEFSTHFRFITKDGDSNWKLRNLDEKRGGVNFKQVRTELWRRLDFFSFIDMHWAIFLFVFSSCFIASWILFAGAWKVIQQVSPDCIFNYNETEDSFTALFLFSIETQQTIGYGSRHIGNNCALGSIMVGVQSLFGILLQTFMTGIVFAKVSRPSKRSKTLTFSDRAVIALRNGCYSLMCRVGDRRDSKNSNIIQQSVSMFLIDTRHTREGECLPFSVEQLELEQSTDKLLLMPNIIEHRITEKSPLYKLIDAKIDPAKNTQTPYYDCFKDDSCFEIVVILEGVIESTGGTTQARTSYLPNEILWNTVFEPIFDFKVNRTEIDFSKFNSVRKVDDYNNNNNNNKSLSLLTLNGSSSYVSIRI